MGIFHNDNDFSKYLDKDLSGSQTEKNLLEAFCGESQARNKYTFFAKQARKDGYEQIAKIFEETANNEAEHGKIWYRLLHKGKMPSTLENLENAVDRLKDRYGNFCIQKGTALIDTGLSHFNPFEEHTIHPVSLL